MDMKNAALEYLEWGLSIIPIKPGDKKPLINWGEFTKRQPTEDEVESWFTQWPNANIGLVTGQVSGVAAIDIDSDEGKAWAKEHLSGENFPVLWQKTAKGSHLLYRANGTIIPNAVRIVDGVDVRGEGGYILIAPSKHPSGAIYELKANDGYFDDLTDFPIHKLPKRDRQDLQPVSLEPVQNGERNNTLARLAGRYFLRGMNYTEVLTLCKGWNADLEQPLDKGEVEKTVASIQKKHQENHPFEGINGSDVSICKQEKAGVSECKQEKASESNCKQGVSNCKPDVSMLKANVSKPAPNSLQQALESWVHDNEGFFTINQIDTEFNLKTRGEKNNRSICLNRLAKQGLIRKDGKRTGQWRIVTRDCEAMDVFGTGAEKLRIPLPLGLSEMVNLYPGSIAVVAGTSNSGKSAFVSNFAFACHAYVSTLRKEYNISIPAYVSKQGKKNPQTFAEYLASYMDPKNQEAQVHYFNSEMASPELRDRLDAYPGGVESFRKVNFWKRSSDFADAIRPNGINIIDFMECYDEFWKIGQWINEIHKELNRGIAIVVLQKKHGAMVGRGGELTMEKPRLYVNLESNAPYGGICKIVKAKSFVDPKDNPNGKEIDFKLIDGWKFSPISKWRHVSEKEREQINRKYKKETGGDNSYAFEFKTEDGIKGLNFKDYENWKQRFKNIDIDDALSNISKTSKNAPLKKDGWFFQLSKILENQNNETDVPF